LQLEDHVNIETSPRG